MEREILFHGRRKDNKEWVEGDLRQDADLERCYISGWNYYCSESGLEREPFEYEVDPATVGQYIGVTGKRGVKLYDGDIVRTKYGRVCLIVWQNNVHGWDLVGVARLDCRAPDKWDLWQPDNLDKIGNIHDNPELLEVEK